MFDIYAFADYSGAAGEAEQRRHIAWCVGHAEPGRGEAGGDRYRSYAQLGLWTTGLTRAELGDAALHLLQDADRHGERVLFGFDHNYSLPIGFFEAAVGRPPTDWRQILHWLASSLETGAAPAPPSLCEAELPPVGRSANSSCEAGKPPTISTYSETGSGQPADDHPPRRGALNPRTWAAAINTVIAQRLGRGSGPFWGPHFVQAKRLFPFGEEEARLPERRLTETRRPGMKSVYQLGGAGSVGLQSLYGMVHLHQLLEACRSAGIALHVWPFDGWQLPEHGHVLAEVYPTICWHSLSAECRQAIAREAAEPASNRSPGAAHGAAVHTPWNGQRPPAAIPGNPIASFAREPWRSDRTDAIELSQSDRVDTMKPRRSDRADAIKPRRSDRADAIACVVWARERDQAGTLASFFAAPALTAQELKRASLEGWVLGAT